MENTSVFNITEFPIKKILLVRDSVFVNNIQTEIHKIFPSNKYINYMAEIDAVKDFRSLTEDQLKEYGLIVVEICYNGTIHGKIAQLMHKKIQHKSVLIQKYTNDPTWDCTAEWLDIPYLYLQGFGPKLQECLYEQFELHKPK